MDDDKKLPRATLRDGKLYVAGEKEPYFRDPERWVSLQVTGLRVFGGYELADITERNSPRVPSRVSVRGSARFTDKDKFAVAGLQIGKNTPITFGLSAVPDEETGFHWRANIGFSRHDWEYDIEEAFYIECYCTPEPFADVLAAVRTGRVDALQLRMSTTMWTRDQSGFFDTPMTWHLAPPADKEPSKHLGHETGSIAQLTWEERCGEQPVKPAADLDSEPKPVVLPKALYTVLNLIVGVGIAIAVMLFLRH